MSIIDRWEESVSVSPPRDEPRARPDTGPASSPPGLAFSFEVIPSRVHGVMDYAVAGLAFLSPYLFGFAHITRARLLMQFYGAAAVVYSLLTNYEWGILRAIPYRTHLLLDLVVNALTVGLSLLLGVQRLGRVPFAFGIFGIAVALLSRLRVGSRNR
jgi:hypothetical protein